MATRRWLRLLLNQYPRLRVVALVDGDPHGLDILATYKNGSAAMSYSAADLCIPELCWLGVRVEDLSARAQARLPSFRLKLSRHSHGRPSWNQATRDADMLEAGKHTRDWST